MKAMIFAAGMGTRLKPFTLEHPKALVPVCGIPMLQRVILKLKSAGVYSMVVNVHHFSEQIVDFLKENDNFGVDIAISDESECLLETGGGLLKAKDMLIGDEPIIVHNADILTDFDIRKMVDAHKKNNALATLLVSKRDTDRQLLLDDNMRMHCWTKLSTGQVLPESSYKADLQPWAFGGVHLLSPQIFDLLAEYADGQKSSSFSIMPFYISKCSEMVINGYSPEERYYWHDIGKPESLERAQRDLCMR